MSDEYVFIMNSLERIHIALSNIRQEADKMDSLESAVALEDFEKSVLSAIHRFRKALQED